MAKTIHALCELVRNGFPRARAKDYGIDPEAPELMRAESEFVMDCLLKINAGVSNWRAYAWMLETCFPDEYGPGRDTGPTDRPDDGFIDALNDVAERVFDDADA
jgi:hypothetical protein